MSNFCRALEERTGCAVIIAGSDSDEPHIGKIVESLKKYEIPFEVRICSAHKQPNDILSLIKGYDAGNSPVAYIAVAGGTDALSGTLSFHTKNPVISCPPDAPNQSCLTNPPGSSNAYIQRPANVGRFIAQMYAPINPRFGELLRKEMDDKIKSLETADTMLRKKFGGGRMSGLEALANMEYPGRFIIIGRDQSGDHNVVVYGITGRSPSSQARKLEFDRKEEAVLVKPTDEETLKKGNPDLLIYPALIYEDDNVFVSNGKQTSSMAECHGAQILSLAALYFGLCKSWTYEPDAPNHTPRISGCCTKDSAALNIIKRAEDGSGIYHLFEIPLIAGKGKLIATYTGENVNPLPSFRGEPLDVEIAGESPEKVARDVYDALTPKDLAKDYRVAVVASFQNIGTLNINGTIVNRHELPYLGDFEVKK